MGTLTLMNLVNHSLVTYKSHNKSSKLPSSNSWNSSCTQHPVAPPHPEVRDIPPPPASVSSTHPSFRSYSLGRSSCLREGWDIKGEIPKKDTERNGRQLEGKNVFGGGGVSRKKVHIWEERNRKKDLQMVVEEENMGGWNKKVETYKREWKPDRTSKYVHICEEKGKRRRRDGWRWTKGRKRRDGSPNCGIDRKQKEEIVRQRGREKEEGKCLGKATKEEDG